ncbi:MAG: winged helix DNA-binding domain-containing protein [Clostridiales bacterium]|nr:winged helix DNA-binding domain-containing protein [Clostridiales bacterium]
MDAEQFKLLRLSNQYLLSLAPPRDVVRGLIGLQAQYGAAALHALRIRASEEPELSRFVKTWSFRGTLHLSDVADLPLVLYRGSETDFGQMALTHESLDQTRCERFRQILLDTLATGNRTRDELKAECLRTGMTEAEAQIILHPWGGLFRAMAERGEIAYAADGNRVFTRLSPMEPMGEEQALSELMGRYLRHYAPVSLRDAQTFFGLPQRRLKGLLERTAADSFSDRGQAYFTSGQQLPSDAALPPVLFLAGFDQLLLGYRKTENPFLPQEAIKSVYNNTGIVFPTVLSNGVVSAIWKRTGNKLELRALRRTGIREKQKIARKAVDIFGKVAVEWIDK